jgi:hypothetical protein
MLPPAGPPWNVQAYDASTGKTYSGPDTTGQYSKVFLVKTPGLQEPGSGQIQCTSWRNFAPFTTSTITDIHASARA